MQHNAGLEVVPDHSSGLELADHYSGRDLESLDQSAGKIHPDAPYEQYHGPSQYFKQDGYTSLAENGVTPQGRRRGIPKIWYIGVALLLIIIVAAVVGGVLGSRAHSGSSQSDAPAANSTTNSTSPMSSNNSTGLASIGYLANAGEMHRVYYQLPSNEIRESSWNSTGKTWYVSKDNIGVARSGSPLAAALGLKPQGGVVTNLFYLDNSGKLSELVSTDGSKWQPGSINTHNIFPAASTKISAAWTRNTNCNSCPISLLVVVQFDGNSIHLYNSTQDNWAASNIPVNAIPATGISLTQLDNDKYPNQLRFFYQIASGDLVAADWVSPAQFADANSSDVQGKSAGWNLNEDHPLGQFAMEAPVTSFSFGKTNVNVTSYGTVTGYPDVVGVLMSGSRGLTATQWFPNGTNSFRPAFKPPAMDSVRNYTALTSHAWGSAYAYNDSGIAEFVFDKNEADQTMTWRWQDTVYAF